MKISDFKLVDPERHKQKFSRVVHEFNDTARDFPKGKSIHALFSEIAEEHADKIALVFKDSSIDYAQLDVRSDQMAAFLIANGVGKEDIVAILMDTSIDLIVGILGILKAGGAYAGINVSYPLERVKYILNDTRAKIIISQKKFIAGINKLQWECDNLKTYLLIDSDNVYEEEETVNELMTADLWNFVGEDATDDIERGGWLSSYTGEPLSRGIMDDYSSNILRKLSPFLNDQTRVLEIGCSSGITMFRILPFVKEYYGTDLSESILARTKEEATARGYNNARFQCLPAHEIDRVDEGEFDVVIINSVIQCFSGYNYLRKVLAKAIGLMGRKGIVFIGDIMDQARKTDLTDSLLAFQKDNAGKGYTTKTDWSNELFIAREFFDDLEWPAIAGVTHSEKISRLASELSDFRYDTMLHIDKDRQQAPPPHRNKYQFGRPELQKYFGQQPFVEVGPGNLAYIIYTSGSSGNPKGVLIEHRGIVRLVRNTNYIQFTPEDVVLQANAISFDASAFEIWGALLNGSALHLVMKEDVIDEYVFPQLMHTAGISVALFIPSLFNHYVQRFPGMFGRLRVLLLGGEAISPQHVQLLQKTAPGVEIINAYGPTENSVISTTYRIESILDKIPIGKPVSNSQCYILNDNNAALPIGIPGELCVSGEGLARAYLNDTALTREKFIDHPFIPGKRLYKTGDLARWQESGDIEFLGRKDSQVKVRGFRIEPTEIEKAMIQIAGVRETVVVVPGNQSELLAFIVTDSNAAADHIREQLALLLPEYMLPTQIHIVDKIPLTSNGKADKKRLLEWKEDADNGDGDQEQPQNETEARLMDIWTDLLGIRKVGIRNNFFNIGGHSLKATQLVSRIKKEFGVEVSIRNIFATPTIREIAAIIEKKVPSGYASIEMLPIQEYYETSHAQQRLWVLDKFEQDKTLYLMPAAFLVQGQLDRIALDQAFKALISRHEILRTSFVSVNHLPKQKIHVFDPSRWQIAYTDLSGSPAGKIQADALIREEAARPFRLDTDPLVRAFLVQYDQDKFIFLLVFHHIICDGWSMNILADELFGTYAAIKAGHALPPPLRIQYKDFAYWQNRQLEGPRLAAHKTYWTGMLAEAPEALMLPADFPRPAIKTYRGDALGFSLDLRVKEALKDCCRQRQVSLFMLLLAAVKTLLYKYSGQQDIVVGSPIAGRQHEDLEGQIGLYVNTLALRTAFSDSECFPQLLEKVKNTTLGAYEHQVYPFDLLVEEMGVRRDLSRSPLFDVWVALLNTEHGEAAPIEAMMISRHSLETISCKFDLEFEFMELDDSIGCAIIYNTDLFAAATIRRIETHFRTLLDNIIQDIVGERETPLYMLEYIGEEERQAILKECNGKRLDYPRSTLASLFERQVEKTPDATALSCSGRHTTYAELNDKANKVANYLLQHYTLEPNALVGLMTGRSENLLVGILGILKTGAAYVPIDAALPEDRIRYMLEDCGASLVLADKLSIEQRPFKNILDIDDKEIERASLLNPVAANSPEDLAYMMYTSGSTGKPKGVMVTHRNVANFLKSMEEQPGIAAGDRLLALTTYSFDISVLELLLPLITGASVILVTRQELYDARLLQHIMEYERPTIIQGTPSTFSLLYKNGWVCTGAPRILCGGERLTAEIGKRLLKDAQSLWNMYGPTETTIWSAIRQVRGDDDFDCIGKPIANTSIYVLDKHGRLVPRGVKGELFIGGEGLARGYHRLPGLTNEKFIADPFHPGGKLYATGDLVKRSSEETLAFLGRKDDQVKIRGYRIELSEIGNVLLEYPGIKEVTVVVKDIRQQPQLVAYYTSFTDIAVEAWRKAAARLLPEYMLPAYFVAMQDFPLTPNGKIDRKALPDPSPEEDKMTPSVQPRNNMEITLTAIWKEILAIGQLGVHDNFFEIGGHSMKAVQLIERIFEVTGIQLDLITVFKYPDIYSQAELMNGLVAAAVEKIPAIEEQDTYPLSHNQRSVWLQEQLGSSGAANNLALGFVLTGKLDRPALENAFQTVAGRHEILATVFPVIQGEPRQKVNHPSRNGIPVTFTALSDHADALAVAEQMAAREANQPFDLEKGPLMRVQLIETAVDKHLLLFTLHHIVGDEWSLEVIFRDIFLLYNTRLEDAGTDLPAPLDIQYKDYSIWQMRQGRNGGFSTASAYWLGKFASPVPSLDLPTDYPPSDKKSVEAERIIFTLSPALSDKIRETSRDNGATVFMTLLSILGVLLHKYTSRTDMVIGTPAACRNHRELKDQVGVYMNMLALRVKFEKDIPFVSLLQSVKDDLVLALAHQHYPFELLMEELLSRGMQHRNPLFDIGFTWQNIEGIADDAGAMQLDGIAISSWDQLNKAVKADCWLHGWEIGDSMRFSLSYKKDRFSSRTAGQMAEYFQCIANAVCHDTTMRINQLPIIGKTGTLMTMDPAKTNEKNRDRFNKINRKPISLQDKPLVSASVLEGPHKYPVVFCPDNEDVVAASWAAENKTMIMEKLAHTGAILFRNFNISSVELFQEMFGMLVDEPMNYADQSSPRSAIAEKLYTSTDHPADQVINMHNELSYSHKWPLHISFCCLQPATSGGQTPIADSRIVLDGLSEATKILFLDKGILYTRNLVEGIGLSWQQVYQTDDKNEVEAYCRNNNIHFEWKSRRHLRISWKRPAIVRHPHTSQLLWFNHGYFFNASNLDAAVHATIRQREDLPFDTAFGDGTPISGPVLQEIREAYEKAQVAFPWHKGDVLLMDNMLMSHGRNAYAGERKIIVGMGNPISSFSV